MKHPKFQIYRGKGRQFYFRLRARNGKVILSSEGYSSGARCRVGIRSVKENARKKKRYRREVARDRQFYFLLTAANKRVIGVSEMYTTRRRRDDGIEAVRRIASAARVEET
jgi:uncharacterized protein YegP (UPF0339 family)